MDKGAIYMAGIPESLRQEILASLGFIQGKLLFKYLGIPFDFKKLVVHQYLPLNEKITANITCWSAKLISYVGRCQLIKSIIFRIKLTGSIYSYFQKRL